MDILINIAMLVVPPIFALTIHDYLRHGELELKRKMFLFFSYELLINLIAFGISWMRGVKGLRFYDMTSSFKVKYAGLGLVLGLVVPFFVCLMTEETITIGGFVRYTKRFFYDFKKYLPYAIRSAKGELRSEVANSYLDWLWWLIEPVCTMMIYTVIFGYVFKASEQYFPVFIFLSITMWAFFTRSITGSVNMIRTNKGIITKIYMPKFILLLSKMFVNGFKMLVSFGIVVLMMLIFKIPFTWKMCMFIPIMLVYFLFTFGLGTMLMHYGVYVNDLGYIVGIVLNMLMYLTGTFYSVSKRIPAPYGEIIETVNPLAFLIANMRNAMLYDKMPNIYVLLFLGFLSLIIAALGIFTIYSNENAYVKVI